MSHNNPEVFKKDTCSPLFASKVAPQHFQLWTVKFLYEPVKWLFDTPVFSVAAINNNITGFVLHVTE